MINEACYIIPLLRYNTKMKKNLIDVFLKQELQHKMYLLHYALFDRHTNFGVKTLVNLERFVYFFSLKEIILFSVQEKKYRLKYYIKLFS